MMRLKPFRVSWIHGNVLQVEEVDDCRNFLGPLAETVVAPSAAGGETQQYYIRFVFCR